MTSLDIGSYLQELLDKVIPSLPVIRCKITKWLFERYEQVPDNSNTEK